MPVFLWTDLMIWVLFALIIIAVVQILRDPHKKAKWRSVFTSKTAMAASIILLFYFTVALFDSVRFEVEQKAELNNKQMLSLLDMGFEHLLTNTERTYSAPFALKEYSSTVVYNDDGSVSQVYLPLEKVKDAYAGEAEVSFDMLWTAFWAFLNATMLLVILIIMHAALHHWRFKKWIAQAPVRLAYEQLKPLPWFTAYITLYLLFILWFWLYFASFEYHVLGTNKVGEDVFYQSLKSIRTGVLIGGLTTVVMLPLALFLGISAGYFKGWVDDVIQYLYTTLNSIPGVLLIAAAVLVMQTILSNHPEWFGTTEERADLRLLFLILILGVTSWTGLCRLLRAETLKISQIEYVTAAKAFGLHPFKIIARHIYPNLAHLILIALVLDFSGLVLAEAVLSYVGVGVDPTMPSWGNMINQARLEMAREPMVWWSLLSAFCFMFVLVLSANLFADRVQWVLNPKNEK